MNARSVKQFAIVRSDSASLFEEQLNAKMIELIDQNPDVTISESGDKLTAKITYTKQIELEPTEKSAAETGIKFTCQDCPMFEPILKGDGTEDGRLKYGNCEFSKFGRTNKASDACEVLYRMIQSGGIGLCYRK